MKQKRLSDLKAQKLNRVRRAAMLLFTMMVALTVQTAWAQDSGEPALHFFTPTLVDAQSTNWDASHYGASHLFDGSYTGGGYGLSEGDVWVEFQFAEGIYPEGYALWTADNCLGAHNPKAWTLKAKNTASEAWTTLTTVDNSAGDKLPLANSACAVFAIDASQAYKYFRFEATKSDAGSFELSELKITSDQSNRYMEYAFVTGLEHFYLYSNGSPIAINYAVADALGHTLTKGTNYTETFRNSAGEVVSEVKEVGEYTLTIEGKNDLENQYHDYAYQGTKTLKFEVVDRKVSLTEGVSYPYSSIGRYVCMPKTGKDLLELDGTVESFVLYDDNWLERYSNNCDGTLTIKAPTGYFFKVEGELPIVEIDKLTIYDGSDIDNSRQIGSSDTYTLSCSTSGEYITFHFLSDEKWTAAGIALCVKLAKKMPHKVEITILGDENKASSEYGTFVADKLMAVNGETVTLSYTTHGEYALADMSIWGHWREPRRQLDTYYKLEEPDDMRWYTDKRSMEFRMPADDVMVTTYFGKLNSFGYRLWLKVPKKGTKSVTIPAGVKEFEIYNTVLTERAEVNKSMFTYGDYEEGLEISKLVLTAPLGYRFKIKRPSYIFTCPGDWVSIYNGPDSDYREVIYENLCGIRTVDQETGEEGRSKFYIDMWKDWEMACTKSGQMCIKFVDNFYGDGHWQGISLVVEVVEVASVVTFDTNGHGTAPEPQTITQSNGFKATQPADPVPESEVFVFKGWYTAEGSLFDFNTPVDKDTTLYAGWAKQSTVHFQSSHGTPPADQYINPNGEGKVAQPADLTDDEWVFTGWYADESNKYLYNFDNLVTGDMTIYAGWVKKDRKCSVSFSVMKPVVDIPYGQEWTDVAIRVYSRNLGWFQNEGKPAREAVELRFTPYVLNNSPLYFVNSSGGNFLTATPGAGEHVVGNIVTTYNGDGRLWLYIPKSAWESADPGEYIQYMPYDAVFYTYQAEHPNSSHNTCPNESYYYYNTTGVENIQQVEFRLTVPENVTLTFDANGGEGAMDAATLRKGIAAQLPQCTFTNATEGVTFLAWNTLADGSGTAYQPGSNLTTDTDLTLYAQWGNEYTLDLSALQTDESVSIPFPLSAQLTTLSGYFENLHYDGDEEGTDHLCLDVNLDGTPDVEWTQQWTVTGTDAEGNEIVEWTASAKKLAGAESFSANHRFLLMATEPGEYNSVVIKFSDAADAVTVLKPAINYLYSDIDNRLEVIPALMDGQKHTVMLKDRKLYKDNQFNTICLPFDVDDLDAVDATRESGGSDYQTFTGTPFERASVCELDVEGEYKVDGVSGFKTSLVDGTLYLFFKRVKRIEAGKPYIIKWAATQANYTFFENPVFHNVFITSPIAEIENPIYSSYEDQYITVPVPGSISFTGGKMVGTYSPTKIYSDKHDKYFFGSGNKLNYPGDPEYTVGPFRAYLDFSESSSAVRHVVMNFQGDGEETGIQEIPCSPADDSRLGVAAWYDLNGRKLSGKPSKKGIYIRNGKKVVIK